MAKISEYFVASYGKIKEPFGDFLQGKTPFVSSGDISNGIVGFFDVPPTNKNIITVARTGSIGSSFYHPYFCAINSDCIVLEPKQEMTQEQMLSIVALLRKNIFRYSYARKVTPQRLLDTKIPNNFIDYLKDINIKEIIKKLSKSSLGNKIISLSDRKWRSFLVEDLFELERGKCGSAEKLLEKGDEMSYIGAKKESNGFMYEVVRDEKFVTKGNCIVFIGDGQGSVGYSTYQPDDFIGSTTLSVGRNKKLNKYIGLFIITLLDKERFKYSFGRKWNGDKLKNTKIKLPVDKDNNPDWKFMEDYIKSLPYSAEI